MSWVTCGWICFGLFDGWCRRRALVKGLLLIGGLALGGGGRGRGGSTLLGMALLIQVILLNESLGAVIRSYLFQFLDLNIIIMVILTKFKE